MKGDQIRGRGLCFQFGAQRSQYRLECTTFDYVYSNCRNGCRDGGGAQRRSLNQKLLRVVQLSYYVPDSILDDLTGGFGRTTQWKPTVCSMAPNQSESKLYCTLGK